jgi:hypothetical protein
MTPAEADAYLDEQLGDDPSPRRPSETARILGVDPKTLVRQADAGRITCMRTLGGTRRFLPQDIRAAFRRAQVIDQLMDARQHQAAGPAGTDYIG